jgi:transposase
VKLEFFYPTILTLDLFDSKITHSKEKLRIRMKTQARIKEANREQMCMEVLDYDQLIAEDHTARIIVKFVEQFNLVEFYTDIKSVPGIAGRSATDPKLLLSLWLYATLEGVGSARLLEKLCEQDNVFRWICGGVRVNYHTLSDFRCKNGEKLDQLLTDIISTFISKRIVKLKSLLIDGTKIKASAGKKSFKNKKRLNKIKKETRFYIEKLRKELDEDPAAGNKRREAAKLSAKEKIQAKVEAALVELPKVEAAKELAKKKVKKGTEVKEAKVSVSDPDARLMKFANKSVQAGYNCQIVMEPEDFIIVGIEISQQRNDTGQLKGMIEQVESRYKSRPDRVLVDNGYQVKQDIIDLAEHEKPVLVYSPLPKKKKNIKQSSLDKRINKEANYPPSLKAFYQRMENKVSQQYYKLRSRIETFNGILHNRMPKGFQLRGKEKVKSELLLQVIAHNIMSVFRKEGKLNMA